jgi:hypothetical protein
VALLPLVRPLETPLIVGASALLWVACVTLNNHTLFEWTELTEFRHLVFVPAGAKIVLIMALGARAALGIWLGSLTFVVSDIPTLSAVQALGLTLAYAGVPLMVITSFSRATGFARPWVGLGRCTSRWSYWLFPSPPRSRSTGCLRHGASSRLKRSSRLRLPWRSVTFWELASSSSPCWRLDRRYATSACSTPAI